MHCSETALSALHLLESDTTINQSCSCEQGKQNSAECLLFQYFRSILETTNLFISKA